jgi:hypothetical protein
VYLDASATQPIIAWCWNQRERLEPHIHTTVADPAGRSFRLHVPTGGRNVTIEQVLRFLVEEWNVTPAADDWDARLAEPLLG